MLHPIDIITSKNVLTGALSNPEDASNKGLWHRGAHAIILTPSGRMLVQKRALDSIQYPGRIDIGVGGFVDSGETPEETIIREIKEETGLSVTQDQLLFLGTSKQNRRWHYRQQAKISRAIIYSYAVRLPHEQNHLTLQSGEVAWAGFIPRRSALWLLHHGSIQKIGAIMPMLAYYKKTLRAMDRFIHIKK